MLLKKILRSLILRIKGRNPQIDFVRRKKRLQKKIESIERIAVIYYIPKANAFKYANWEDGFTKAMDILSEEYEIRWFNLEDGKPSEELLNSFDLVIAKSCWHWVVDNYIQSLKSLKVIKGIVVSCSIPPRSHAHALHYDIVWFQTMWYKKYIEFHPNIYYAYGINSDVFKPQNVDKEIDVLAIGAITAYKRFEKLNDIEGKRKVIIGTTKTKDFYIIREKLDPSIEIIEYLSQEELAAYINKSKLVYIPCEVDGGGERAVLESRSCDVPVRVEEDNPKLMSLLTVESFGKDGYYKGIKRAIEGFFV